MSEPAIEFILFRWLIVFGGLRDIYFGLVKCCWHVINIAWQDRRLNTGTLLVAVKHTARYHSCVRRGHVTRAALARSFCTPKLSTAHGTDRDRWHAVISQVSARRGSIVQCCPAKPARVRYVTEEVLWRWFPHCHLVHLTHRGLVSYVPPLLTDAWACMAP